MAVLDPCVASIAKPKNGQARAGWSLAFPALTLMALILLVPIIVACVLSFTNYSLGNPGFDWVGVQNYERLFTRSTSHVQV